MAAAAAVVAVDGSGAVVVPNRTARAAVVAEEGSGCRCRHQGAMTAAMATLLLSPTMMAAAVVVVVDDDSDHHCDGSDRCCRNR